MNRRALLVAALAAVCSAALLYVYIERFKAEATGGRPVGVLFAVQDIPLGTILTKKMVAIRDVPESYVDARHVRSEDAESVFGVRVSMAIKADESVLWTDLATLERRRDLSALVKPGMRAITVRADLAGSVGGLLRPGDRVDALLTTERTTAGAERTVPLLQNLLVLAIGRDTGGDERFSKNGDRTAGQLNEVTVSATVNQAQLLTFAQSQGELTLILRNPDDIAMLEGLPETSAADIEQSDRRAKIIRREAPVAAPVAPHTIERVQ